MLNNSMRRDPLNNCWVIFAPEKVNTIIKESSEKDAKFDINPYLPGLEHATGRDILRKVNPAYADKGWSSRVFPAKNPVLRVETEKKSKGNGVYDEMLRGGAHEVVVETPRSDIYFDKLSIEEIVDAFSIVRERIGDLKNDSRFRYILVSKNRGKESGGTIDHNYSEIKAFPFVPPLVQKKVDNCIDYFERKDRCLICDIVEKELEERSRIVFESELFVAICPYASRFPFEIMIIPKRHRNIFDNVSPEAVKDLAVTAKTVFGKMRKALNSPAYNCVFHYHPVNSGPKERIESLAYHWHITIIPRITTLTSDMFESGVYVNPTLPENAADFMRNISE
jgi:UDPglucose--hexose-1-phosphate uridylyltransferase